MIHKAPLDKSCKKERNPAAGEPPCEFFARDEPDNWKTVAFDDSSWSNAVEYTESEIRPKDGFNDITWYSAARFIWSEDLETDNTVLCRLKINGPADIKHISNEKASFSKPVRNKERRPDEPPPPRPDGSRPPPRVDY